VPLPDPRIGPLRAEADWLLARQRELAPASRLDERKEDTWRVYAGYLVAALRAGAVEEVVAFVH